MRLVPLSAIIVALFLGTVFHTAPVQAQVPVFVANTGLDENPCSFSAPCRTFQQAHDVSPTGGVIEALDATDYLPVNITKAITIRGHGLAGINVPTGNVGISLNAPASARVIIDGVNITGTTNTAGVAVNAGLLTLMNSTVQQVTNGVVVFQTKADLINTNIIGSSGVGIKAIGQGADQGSPPPPAGPTFIRIDGGSSIGNATAFQMQDPGTATGSCNRVSIWIFSSGSGWSMNVVGYTTLLTIAGTGSGNPCAGVTQYANSNGPL